MISNPTPTIPILYKYKFLLNYRLTKGNGGIKHASLIVRKTMQTDRQCNTGSWATVQTFLFGVGIFSTFSEIVFESHRLLALIVIRMGVKIVGLFEISESLWLKCSVKCCFTISIEVLQSGV